MAKPPPDLRQSLKKHDARAPAPVIEKAAPAERPDNPHYRPSRADQENITGYDLPAVKSQLLELTLKRRKELGRKVTIQDLIDEGLNDLFAKYGLPEIAGSTRRKEGHP